ncbi:MAG TPA: hypothetical protein VGQ85_00390, partial [Candidatus Limnocylindrales bacterium]|nr:hypothetical protein [Candidatus Limnocylindrales bacterium]
TTPSFTVPPTPVTTPPPAGSAASVAFWDYQHGIVVGAGSDGRAGVWATTDGGRTWQATRLDVPPLDYVTVAGDSLAWAMLSCPSSALPHGCGVLASRDRGATWARVSDRAFSALSFTGTDGWAVTNDDPTGPANTRGVFHSNDGGRTWTEIAAAPCSSIGRPVAVSFVGMLHGWVGCSGFLGAGQGGKGIVETEDGGRTWTVRARTDPSGQQVDVGSIPTSDYLVGISMRASGVGIAWESRGGTLRTTDRGRTWTAIPPGGSDAGPLPLGACTGSDRDWFVVMWDGTLQATALWASHDAGSTWTSVSQVPPPSG